MNDQTHIELLTGRIEAERRNLQELKDLIRESEKRIIELEVCLIAFIETGKWPIKE